MGTYFYKDVFRDQNPCAAVCSSFGVKLNSLVQALDYLVKRGRAAPVKRPWECYSGRTVSSFVWRTSLAMRAGGMFSALSWSWAQCGWVFCWLPLSGSWVMGLPLFAFGLCVCVCANVPACHFKAALVFMNVICACSNCTPVVWWLFFFFLNFLAQKGPSDLDLVPEEYSVMIGSYPCNISFHNDQLFHCTINGLLGSSERELPVTVSIHVTARKKTLSSLFRKYL